MPERLETGSAALRWPRAVREALDERASRGYPHEVCGLMIGRETDRGIEVRRITEARNLRTDRPEDRYVLNPEDFLVADAAARRERLDVVGIWHTHPDHPPKPSRTDLEAAWEGYSYVILSVGASGVADVRSWRLDEARFVEQPIEEATA